MIDPGSRAFKRHDCDALLRHLGQSWRSFTPSQGMDLMALFSARKWSVADFRLATIAVLSKDPDQAEAVADAFDAIVMERLKARDIAHYAEGFLRTRTLFRNEGAGGSYRSAGSGFASERNLSRPRARRIGTQVLWAVMLAAVGILIWAFAFATSSYPLLPVILFR